MFFTLMVSSPQMAASQRSRRSSPPPVKELGPNAGKGVLPFLLFFTLIACMGYFKLLELRSTRITSLIFVAQVLRALSNRPSSTLDNCGKGVVRRATIENVERRHAKLVVVIILLHPFAETCQLTGRYDGTREPAIQVMNLLHRKSQFLRRPQIGRGLLSRDAS